MKGLLEAPDDIKLKIFEVSDPQDIRTCQLVCRSLCSLIVSSPQIQYILTLDALGYAMPSVPRLDLTPRHKVEFLKQHRRNWSFPSTPQLTEYVLPLHEAGSHNFNGGVYACALFFDKDVLSTDQRIMGIHFYRIPSLNLGLEFREWSIPDFGLMAHDFTFDTAQDLLVLVELVDPSRDWSEGCRIHLRTMNNNSQHPRTVVPFLLAEFSQSEGYMGHRPFAATSLNIKVVGNSLAILFRSRTDVMPSWVVVWDWNRGGEVTRISIDRRQSLSAFTLLSQNRLLVPRHSKSHYVQEDVPNDTCGSLDVYAFDPDVTTSTPARMITSFELPTLDVRSCESVLLINGRQLPKPPSTYTDTRPMVYDPSAQDRLIAVAVWFRSLNTRAIYQHDFLYIPSSILLRSQASSQSLDNTQAISTDSDAVTKVSWDTWAPLISRREGDGSNAPGNCLHGQRAAIISNGREEPPKLVLLGFGQRTVRLAKSSKENTTCELAMLPNVTMSVDLSRGSSSQGRTTERGWGVTASLPPVPRNINATPAYFETRAHLSKMFRAARAEYVMQAWLLPRGPRHTLYRSVTMDDEHVIVLKV